MDTLFCPACGSTSIKRNGHTHYGKQNYRCRNCHRQFVADSQRVSPATQELVKKLLLERISLRGICRVAEVSLTWLLNFIAQLYSTLPDDLNAQAPTGQTQVQLFCWDAEMDEMWSFVGNKANRQWIWLAFDTTSWQVIAFYVGDRSRQSAQTLWQRLPAVYRQHATFYTDDWEAYKGVIPSAQHRVCTKGSGQTNMIERFNCTLRQRVSRLVRRALSFSKKLSHHIGAIKYFLCHYNLEMQRLNAQPALLL